MEAWPFDSTKRSRSHQYGLPGLNLSTSRHSTSAMSAIPMGAPGWPELAFWTASIERARMALASSRRVGMSGFLLNKEGGYSPRCALRQQIGRKSRFGGEHVHTIAVSVCTAPIGRRHDPVHRRG